MVQMRCAAIHGDKDQFQRTQTLDAFKHGICPARAPRGTPSPVPACAASFARGRSSAVRRVDRPSSLPESGAVRRCSSRRTSPPAVWTSRRCARSSTTTFRTTSRTTRGGRADERSLLRPLRRRNQHADAAKIHSRRRREHADAAKIHSRRRREHADAAKISKIGPLVVRRTSRRRHEHADAANPG